MPKKKTTVIREVVKRPSQALTIVTRGPKPRKQPGRKRRNQGSGMSSTGSYARSLLDPFNYSACVPDGSNNAGCFTVKQQYQFATGAAGQTNLLAWNPARLGALYKEHNNSTSTTPVVAGNWVDANAFTDIVNLYGTSRPISAGLKASYTGPTITDGGTIVCGVVSGDVAPASFNAATLNTAVSMMMEYKLFPLRSGAKITWRPGDMMDTAEYRAIEQSLVSVASDGFSYGAPYLILIVYGAASNQSTLQVEAVANYEGQYRSQTFMPGGLSSKSQVHSEAGWYDRAREALRNVSQIANGLANGVSDAMETSVGQAAIGYGIGVLRQRQGGLGRSGMPRLTL